MTLVFQGTVLYLVTRGEATDVNFAATSAELLKVVRLAVAEKVSLIQIREKQLPARLLFELTVSAAEVTRGSSTRLLVNDRADIALAAGADGVHLTTTSVPPRSVRENFPEGFVIGVSAHSRDEVANAARAGADFAVFGPVFETPGKGHPQGLSALSGICETVRPFPVIGIGGIDSSNCLSVLAAGAAGIGAIRVLDDPDSLRGIARLIRR